MTEVIDVRGLVKCYGSTRALDGLDLSVRTGEIHGFVGPNGAGKSTTVRVLLGMLRADAGEVRLLDGDPWGDAVSLHRRLAYVPGDVTLWPNLTGGEIVDLLGRLRGGFDRARRDALIERFELDPRKKARTYSTGNRQKVALVAALSSRSELLILDEPTAGLDPLMEATFRECALEEREAGRTVLLSSHILSEVEAVCDRVTIVRHGRTVGSGTLDELRHLTLRSVTAQLSGVPEGLDNVDGIHELRTEGSTVHFQVDQSKIDNAMRAVLACGLVDLTTHPPNLEDLFLRHYQEDFPDSAAHDTAAQRAQPRAMSAQEQEHDPTTDNEDWHDNESAS